MANFDGKAIVNTPTYSRVNLTYESIGTLQMGLGTPVFHKKVVPGDDWRLSVDQIMRLAPLSSPVFDDVSLHFRAFFVPNRIIDPRWKEFITAGIGLYGATDAEISPLRFTNRSLCSASDERNPSIHQPYTTATYAAGVGGLADWLNFHYVNYDPTTGRPWDVDSTVVYDYTTADTDSFDLLPFLGYQKIYDDWYRNERVQSERLPSIISYLQETAPDERTFDLDCSTLGSSEARNPFRLWRVNYGKDRYTTALPEPVIGGEVTYPSGASGDYNVTSDLGSWASSGYNGSVGNLTIAPDTGNVTINTGSSSVSAGPLMVTLAAAAENTIRNLKTAFKMYDFFMKDTYGGNRYVEFMENHFNVRVPDSTLDRAIYLGDHKVRISFGEVFQTSQGTTDSEGILQGGVLGDYAGRGAAYSEDGFLFSEKFLEHGQLYVIASIVPRAKYFQGVDRKFFVTDRFSYFFPEFQNIGDDQLYRAELYNYATGTDAYTEIFGFAPRWSELKESLDEVHGDFLTDSMDEYHFGRRFDDFPKISGTFSEVPSINRPFSVTDAFSENYMINMRWSCSAARPVMLYDVF